MFLSGLVMGARVCGPEVACCSRLVHGRRKAVTSACGSCANKDDERERKCDEDLHAMLVSAKPAMWTR